MTYSSCNIICGVLLKKESLDLIELRHVTLKDQKNILARDLSLKLNNGSIYGICADTDIRAHLASVLCGARLPLEGAVLINGFDTAHETQRAKAFLCCVPDEQSLYPTMTALEYLLFIADAFGMEDQKAIRKISDVLDFTELSMKRNMQIQNLSLYEKKRLALSQALLCPGDIYLLSSPFKGLSPSQKSHFGELLSDALEGSTAILTDATESTLFELCDTVYMLKDNQFTLLGREFTKDMDEDKEEQD